MKPRYHVLPAIPRRLEYYDRIGERLTAFMREAVYVPLMKELGAGHLSLRNSYDDLIDAVASGRIQYVRGHFEGKFNVSISAELTRIGAVWKPLRGWFELPQAKLPLDIRSAIGTSQSRFEAMAAKVDGSLQDMLAQVQDPNGGWFSGRVNLQDARAAKLHAERLKIEKVFDDTIYHADRDFQKNVAKVTVSPVLTPESRARMAAEYSRNLSLSIQDFMSHEIVELREKVSRQAGAGIRYEAMVRDIQHSYGVSERKAKSLARQETSLLMSKFKQLRYEESGIPEYQWQCVRMPKDASPNHHTPGNVRFYHGLLDGKVFHWNTGAVVNAQGQRKNPGQDWECRCNAAPVVRF